MKIFKKYEVSIAFWSIFQENRELRGLRLRNPLERHTSKFAQIFDKNSRHLFYKICIKIMKNWRKIVNL